MSPPRADRFAVVDTTVFGAELTPAGRWLAEQYRVHTTGRALFVSWVTVAELRYGARLASWGAPRLSKLDERLELAEIVWPNEQLVDVYADFRVECHRTGHGLSQKVHEADRWIAATAIWLDLPLIAHDTVFIDAPGLELLTELDHGRSSDR